jgi:hypothetical protein
LEHSVCWPGLFTQNVIVNAESEEGDL